MSMIITVPNTVPAPVVQEGFFFVDDAGQVRYARLGVEFVQHFEGFVDLQINCDVAFLIIEIAKRDSV